MARLSQDEVLACVLDSDDSDDVFGLVNSSSEGEQNGETEEVTAFMGQQLLSRDSLDYLSDLVYYEYKSHVNLVVKGLNKEYCSCY